MKTTQRQVNTAITLPPQLLTDAIRRSTVLYGPRGFSMYVRNLILADLKKARRN